VLHLYVCASLLSFHCLIELLLKFISLSFLSLQSQPHLVDVSLLHLSLSLQRLKLFLLALGIVVSFVPGFHFGDALLILECLVL
jgi:hypothetical protein